MINYGCQTVKCHPAVLICCLLWFRVVGCSGVIGTACYRWLNHVDGYLNADTSLADKEIHWQEILKYPDYIYEAIDMTKSGKQVCQSRPQSSLRSDFGKDYMRLCLLELSSKHFCKAKRPFGLFALQKQKISDLFLLNVRTRHTFFCISA